MIKQLISVTPSALGRLISIQKQHHTNYLSFGVKSGGCSGFQYVIKPCSKKLEGEDLFEQDNLKIKIKKEDSFLLLGTEIDWEDDIMGQRFIFKNPNSNFQCGCGKSFS